MATKKKIDEEEVFKEILAMDASKTEYVPCGWVGSFSDLTDAQKRYYAYFRTILGIGSKNIRGDDGYYYLLVKECSRSEEDHRRLLDYLEIPKSSKFYNYASDLLPDLQMLYGRPPDLELSRVARNMVDAVLTQIFLPKYEGATESQLDYLIEELKDGFPIYRTTYVNILGQALSILDEDCISRTGKSLGETYVRGQQSVCHRLFEHKDLFPQKDCIIIHSLFRKGFYDLLKETIQLILERNDSGFASYFGIKNPKYVPADLVGTIRGLRSKFMEMPKVPKTDSPLRVLIADENGHLDDDYPAADPLYNRYLTSPEWTDCPPSKLGGKQYESIMGSIREPYTGMPLFPRKVTIRSDGLTEGDSSYYRYWRLRWEQGVKLPFNEHMAIICFLEMQEGGLPYDRILGQLLALSKQYGLYGYGVSDLVVELTVFTDSDVDLNMSSSFHDLRGHILYRLMTGKDQRLEKWFFSSLCKFRDFEDWLYDDGMWMVLRNAFILTLRKAYREGRFSKGTHGIGLEEKRYVSALKLTEPDLMDYETARINATIIEKDVASLVENLNKWYYNVVENGRWRRKDYMLFGVNITPIVNRLIEKALEPSKPAYVMPDLDPGMISQASVDRDYVVSAVGIDDTDGCTDDDDSPVMEERDEQADGGDPWKKLAMSLSAAEKDYIGRCIAGTKPDMGMENAINCKATETVGDVIVEDGEIIDDYAEEISDLIA